MDIPQALEHPYFTSEEPVASEPNRLRTLLEEHSEHILQAQKRHRDHMTRGAPRPPASRTAGADKSHVAKRLLHDDLDSSNSHPAPFLDVPGAKRMHN